MCYKCQNNLLFSQDENKQSVSPKFALPGSFYQYSPDKIVQVKNIFLDLEFDLEQSFYHGSCKLNLEVIATNISTIEVDAVNLNILKVVSKDIELNFEYDSKKIFVNLGGVYVSGQELELEIFYSKSNSSRGLYFIKPTKNQPNKPYQVWSQGESEESSHWFPCFESIDQLSTSEVRVKVKNIFKTVSNGLLVDSQIQGDFRIDHWKLDKIHPSYLIALAIGEFTEIKDENPGSVPLSYYAEDSKAHMMMPSSGKTRAMMQFLEEKFGYPYPWGKYAQIWVSDFRYGGMENTSCTILLDDALTDEKAKLEFQYAETVAVHELAHHWFGDLVVAKHWSHAWLKEGAVSYVEVLWWEKEYGFEAAAYYRLNEMRRYFEEDATEYRRPVVTNFYRNPGELYDRHLYEKGAGMYHMIHQELGDDMFWKSVNTFLVKHAHSNVETVDLMRAIETTTGRNLKSLFDQYIFRGGYPDYKVSYSWDSKLKLAKISVSQTQAKDDKDFENIFDLNIPVSFGYINSEKTTHQEFKLRLNQKDHTFYFPLENRPSFVSFDPENHFIKKVSLDYPIPELNSQLKYDKDPISRIFAAEALSKKGGLVVLDILKEALQNETFWGVKVEIIGFLNEIKLDQVKEVLVMQLKQSDPRVKKAAILALANFKSRDTFDLIKPFATDSVQSYFVQAAALRVLGVLGASRLVDDVDQMELVDLFDGILLGDPGWGEVVRSAAISGLASLKVSAALDKILKYCQPSASDRLRRTAVRSLGIISKNLSKAEVTQIIQTLDQISKENDFYMEIAVSYACLAIESIKVLPILEHIKKHSDDPRSSRIAEEIIPIVMKNAGPTKSIQEIKEELEKVNKTNQDLKSRLELLEAKKI